MSIYHKTEMCVAMPSVNGNGARSGASLNNTNKLYDPETPLFDARN